jgi:predicted DNA-binding transcriptional regulator YafY
VTPPADDSQALRFLYVNWKGEAGLRRATPISIRIGTSQWHPQPGTLMLAYDHDKNDVREFALRDCDFLTPSRSRST